MKRKIRSIVFGNALTLFCCASLYAQAGGGQAGAFLRYGVGGRAMGMGRSFVAVSDDASGVYWNPAGIVGAKRIELTSMYSNLYYDSQFAHFGVVVPRPCDSDSTKTGLLRFLFGPSTSLGFGFVGMSMAEFEQRTNTGLLLGNFGFSENAFLLAWAREEVGSWGIFRYGINFKYVGQNFSGLQASKDMELSEISQDWSPGLDIGFIFQPINTPLFRLISLRYLLPLRFGLCIQNVIQPKWNFTENHRDVFPIVVRFGLSYRWILQDWIPETWEPVRTFFGNSQILTCVDKEWYAGEKSGTYFGAEMYLPITESGVAFFPRFGFNNRDDGTSLGIGFSIPFTSSAIVRIDYAYGFHSYLPEDNRFFITVMMGANKGAGYFEEQSQREDIGLDERRDYLLRILSEYPNTQIAEAVSNLSEIDDSTNVRRYIELKGGLGRAEWFFDEAKGLLEKSNMGKAKNRANDAAKDYYKIFMKLDHSLTDLNLLNYGEALVIANRVNDAINVLEEIEVPSLRYYFVLGICMKSIGEWRQAIEMFKSATKELEKEMEEETIEDPDKDSMICLSFLGWGESLLKTGQYDAAITTLEIVQERYPDKLKTHYPRYPIFEDDYIIDDAQFLMAICNLRDKPERGHDGVIALMQTLRLYPDLEYGRLIEENSEELIEVLLTSNWERLKLLVNQLEMQYYNKHQWPLSQ